MMIEQGSHSLEVEKVPFFPSMTFEQTEMLQNAGRQILIAEQHRGRPLNQEERAAIFNQREIPHEHRILGPGAHIQFEHEGELVEGTIPHGMMWLEHQMYSIPDDAENRSAYEQAVQDVANHTFHLHVFMEHGSDVPPAEQVFDVRELGLLSEVPGTSRVQVG